MKAPVVFLIFRRPETTQKVFNSIRKVKPEKLFVIADGPRSGRLDEKVKCEKTRAIIEQVDWDCEIFKKYSDVNLGCKTCITSGLDWVFSQVEEAIILEDDCFPDITFFQFCEEMLEKYRYDTRIMSVTGTNALDSWKRAQQSYHFSHYGSIWGWATWRRAWNYYDINMELWGNPETQSRIKDVLGDRQQFEVRKKRFDKKYRGEIDPQAWGPQWLFMQLLQSGLAVVPCVNLISNIGFGKDSTHTSSKNDRNADRPTSSLEFPLKEPIGVVADRLYDRKYYENNFAIDRYWWIMRFVWKFDSLWSEFKSKSKKK